MFYNRRAMACGVHGKKNAQRTGWKKHDPRVCGDALFLRRELIDFDDGFRRRGQSLIEILVAIGIGVVMVVGALAILVPTLKTSVDLRHAQVAGGLARELLDTLRVVSERNWHSIDSLATTSVNRYFVSATSSPFSVATGTESVVVEESAYTRYFYVDDVMRDTSGKVDESGSLRDPSTKKVTIVYAWPPREESNTIVYYLTRYRQELTVQTDWSGGDGAGGPVNAMSGTFAFSSSTNIDYSTSTGSIVINGF